MRRSWISLVAMSLGLSLLLSAFFVGLIFPFTYRSGQPLKRLAIERTAPARWKRRPGAPLGGGPCRRNSGFKHRDSPAP